jgi:hypothetical protein
MTNINVKCKSLLYARLWLTSAKEDSITSMLMRKRKIPGPMENPPNAHGLPNKLPLVGRYLEVL